MADTLPPPPLPAAADGFKPRLRGNHMCHQRERFIAPETLFDTVAFGVVRDAGWRWCPGCRTWSTDDPWVVRATILDKAHVPLPVVGELIELLTRNTAPVQVKGKRALDLGS